MAFPLREASGDFFGPLGGSVLDVHYEPLEPEQDTLDAEVGATVSVAFDNAGLFGDADADIYDEVYPRYRDLRNEWWAALRERADELSSPLRPYLLPVPTERAAHGLALPLRRPSVGDVSVVPLDSVPRSSYLDRVRREYGLDYGIRGASGRLFDLAEGLLLAVRSAADAVTDLSSVVDLGAGTGAATNLVLRRTKPKRVLVQDDRTAVGDHLAENLWPSAREQGAGVDVVVGDARTLSFVEPIDLLVISLPFAQQPSLLAHRGAELREALGAGGVLVSASSMVGMRFYQALIAGDDPRLRAWPWYAATPSLRTLFAGVGTVRVRNLLVTVASNSSGRVDAVVAGMVGRGGELVG